MVYPGEAQLEDAVGVVLGQQHHGVAAVGAGGQGLLHHRLHAGHPHHELGRDDVGGRPSRIVGHGGRDEVGGVVLLVGGIDLGLGIEASEDGRVFLRRGAGEAGGVEVEHLVVGGGGLAGGRGVEGHLLDDGRREQLVIHVPVEIGGLLGPQMPEVGVIDLLGLGLVPHHPGGAVDLGRAHVGERTRWERTVRSRHVRRPGLVWTSISGRFRVQVWGLSIPRRSDLGHRPTIRGRRVQPVVNGGGTPSQEGYGDPSAQGSADKTSEVRLLVVVCTCDQGTPPEA